MKINPELLSNIKDTKNSDDNVNSNQSWNNTNEEFTNYGGMETQRRCEEIKWSLNRIMITILQIWWIKRRFILSCLVMK